MTAASIAVARTPSGNWLAVFLPRTVGDVTGFGATKYAAVIDLLLQIDGG